MNAERACSARAAALELALQTTLLGLAIAIILALLAALVGPLLIDWGGHRSLFEAEASRLIGVDVRVTGAIDARLLPSPRLTLHDIEIGSSGEDKIRARALGFEFALGPLMRGEWRAAEMHLVGPQLSLGLDASGHVLAPNLAIKFNPDGLSIDRLSIEDGKVTLTDAANGARVTLDRLWFNGEARSLLGPFKGEGAVTIGGELYPFRIAAGRYGDDGALRLHVNVDPVNHPLSIEADGMLALAGGEPRFDGTLSLTRPVGIASRSAAQLTQTLSQPWRVSGKIKATAASALMRAVRIPIRIGGAGAQAHRRRRFQIRQAARASTACCRAGRSISIARSPPTTAAGRRRPPPSARLRNWPAAAFRPAIPIQIGVGIDQVTLGGSSVAELARRHQHRRQGLEFGSFRISRARLHAGAAERPSCGRRRRRRLHRAGRDRSRRSEGAGGLAGGARRGGAGRLAALEPARRCHARQREDRDRAPEGRVRPQDRHRPPRLCRSRPASIRPSSMPRSTRPSSISTPRSALATRCSPAPISSGRTT